MVEFPIAQQVLITRHNGKLVWYDNLSNGPYEITDNLYFRNYDAAKDEPITDEAKFNGMVPYVGERRNGNNIFGTISQAAIQGGMFMAHGDGSQFITRNGRTIPPTAGRFLMVKGEAEGTSSFCDTTMNASFTISNQLIFVTRYDGLQLIQVGNPEWYGFVGDNCWVDVTIPSNGVGVVIKQVYDRDESLYSNDVGRLATLHDNPYAADISKLAEALYGYHDAKTIVMADIVYREWLAGRGWVVPGRLACLKPNDILQAICVTLNNEIPFEYPSTIEFSLLYNIILRLVCGIDEGWWYDGQMNLYPNTCSCFCFEVRDGKIRMYYTGDGQTIDIGTYVEQSGMSMKTKPMG